MKIIAGMEANCMNVAFGGRLGGVAGR